MVVRCSYPALEMDGGTDWAMGAQGSALPAGESVRDGVQRPQPAAVSAGARHHSQRNRTH